MTNTLTDPPTASPSSADAGPGLDRSDLSPTPSPSRPLWVVFGTILTLGTLLWGTFQVVSVIAREQWSDTRTASAAGISRLWVNNDNGRVVVRGADTDQIVIDADYSRGLFGLDESVGTAGDQYRIDADCPALGEWCWVNYEITVPRHLDVEIDTGNGRVSVSGVDGAIDIDTDNGRVELADASGTVRAAADNGRIVGSDLASAVVDVETENGSIDLTFAEPPDSVTAATDNGSIDLALPDVEGDYNVVAPRTGNGGVEVNIASDPSSARVIETSTDNGSITIRPN